MTARALSRVEILYSNARPIAEEELDQLREILLRGLDRADADDAVELTDSGAKPQRAERGRR